MWGGGERHIFVKNLQLPSGALPDQLGASAVAV